MRFVVFFAGIAAICGGLLGLWVWPLQMGVGALVVLIGGTAALTLYRALGLFWLWCDETFPRRTKRSS
jgi:hypothetical protein